jgi:FkbM family methyltransferase
VSAPTKALQAAASKPRLPARLYGLAWYFRGDRSGAGGGRARPGRSRAILPQRDARHLCRRRRCGSGLSLDERHLPRARLARDRDRAEPCFCAAHRAAGYEVYGYASSDHDEDGVDFELVDSHGSTYGGGTVSFESFSSLAVKPAYRALKPELDVKRIKVDVRRLDTILAVHAPDIGRIDVLSVDVEGWELAVLDGLSFERYRPTVLIVENLFREGASRRAVRARGYTLWRRRGPNDVYVSPALLFARGARDSAPARAPGDQTPRDQGASSGSSFVPGLSRNRSIWLCGWEDLNLHGVRRTVGEVREGGWKWLR